MFLSGFESLKGNTVDQEEFGEKICPFNGGFGLGLGDTWAYVNWAYWRSFELGKPVALFDARRVEIERYRLGRMQEIIDLINAPGRVMVTLDRSGGVDVPGRGTWALPYWPTKIRWSTNKSKIICYHDYGETVAQGMPPAEQVTILKRHFRVEGYEFIELNRNVSLPQAVELLSKAEAFVGLCSGFSHIAHAVGTPTFLVFGTMPPEHVPFHHVGKNYIMCTDWLDFITKWEWHHSISMYL